MRVLSLAWIVVISGVDTWYTVFDGLPAIALERNPLVTWILLVGGLPGFTMCKLIGTSVVVYSLCEMSRREWFWCGTVTTVLCMVQSLVLMSYLPRWM